MDRIPVLITGLVIAFVADASDCLTCHADLHGTLDGTPHAILSRPDDGAESCRQCHGAGDEHVMNPAAGGVLAFRNEPARIQDEACGSCHADAHAGGRGVHASANVPCTGCHSVHGRDDDERQALPAGFGDLLPGSAICANCHEDVLAQFAANKRHRLAENSLTCIDCHEPHAEARARSLHDSSDSVCSDCHAEQAGPFVFEHGASRVDGCLSCHAAHGSANRFLLTHQQVGEQCYSCHAGVPQFHLGFAPVGSPRFGRDSVCTNCHVTIHGSNLDRAFLK